MLFIFLLGAVVRFLVLSLREGAARCNLLSLLLQEIVPLFLGHITGKQYPVLSHLQPPGGVGDLAAGDPDGSPSGHGPELGSAEGSSARMSEIERLKQVIMLKDAYEKVTIFNCIWCF